MTLSGDQIFMLILTTIIAVIAFFLKDLKKRNDDDHIEFGRKIEKVKTESDTKIDAIRENVNNFIATLPHNYVLRDDFLRAISSMDMKMDKIAMDVGELNKNVSKLLAGGTEREH